jgi:hypothetical protein
MSSSYIKIAVLVRVLSLVMAIFASAVLGLYFFALTSDQWSAFQLIFVPPVLATLFAWYIALAGRFPFLRNKTSES